MSERYWAPAQRNKAILPRQLGGLRKKAIQPGPLDVTTWRTRNTSCSHAGRSCPSQRNTSTGRPFLSMMSGF